MPTDHPAPLGSLPEPPTPPSGLAVHWVPDGQLLTFDPEPSEGDLSALYALDVLGVSISVYVSSDESLVVYLDTEDAVSDRQGRPITYEINTGGMNHITRAHDNATVEQDDSLPAELSTEPRMRPVTPCDGAACDAPTEIRAGDGRRVDAGTDHPHTCPSTPAWIRAAVRTNLAQRPPEPVITQPTDTDRP